MKKNIGSADKVIRIILAVTLAVLYLQEPLPEQLALFYIAGGILLATALINFARYGPFWNKHLQDQSQKMMGYLTL